MKLGDIAEYQKDIELSLDSIINISKLKGKSVLVTGATGLIGSSIVDQLLFLNKAREYDMKVYACSRNLQSLKDRFGTEETNLLFVEYDVTQLLPLSDEIDYIVHAASPASPELYVNHPVETMTSNFIAMYNLLHYAKDHNVKRVVYISSSEIYGQKENSLPFEESEQGYLELLNVRTSYPSSKRATETLCACFAEEYDIDVMIARPGHIYGPSARLTDNRLSSLFVNQAIEGKDLVMKSTGEQLRSYTYSLDCSSAILTLLLAGQKGQAYNISNKNSIVSIRELSETIADVAKVNLLFELPTETERKQHNPMMNASLNSDKIEELGWKGFFDSREGIEHTVCIMKELVKQRGE